MRKAVLTTLIVAGLAWMAAGCATSPETQARGYQLMAAGAHIQRMAGPQVAAPQLAPIYPAPVYCTNCR